MLALLLPFPLKPIWSKQNACIYPFAIVSTAVLPWPKTTWSFRFACFSANEPYDWQWKLWHYLWKSDPENMDRISAVPKMEENRILASKLIRTCFVTDNTGKETQTSERKAFKKNYARSAPFAGAWFIVANVCDWNTVLVCRSTQNLY